MEALNDIIRRMENQTLRRPFILILRDFIPHTYLVAIPTTTGVRQIEGPGKVRVQIRFILNAKSMIIVLFPNILAVIRRARTTMHADALDRNQFPQLLQVLAKILIRSVHIPIAGGQRLIVITDFMSKRGNLPDDFLIPAFGDGAEIVDAWHPHRGFQPGSPEGIGWEKINVVPKNQRLKTISLERIK